MAKKPKTRSQIVNEAIERESKVNAKNSKRASKGTYKLQKADAKYKNSATKRQQNRLAAASVLGTEMMGAYMKSEEERTKRAALNVEHLKSWNSLIDGNPSPENGQEGQSQQNSTTDMGSTDRKARESVNYG